VLAALLVAACTDDVTVPTAPVTVPAEPISGGMFDSRGRDAFERYVAIGTSVSMGWQSDGVFAATQSTSWPSQLARLAGHQMTQPYIAPPGCRSPLVAPLTSFVRLSGESAALPTSALSCSPSSPGVVLPAENVAINAATTFNAIYTTPETSTDPSNRALYARVLPPGRTQLQSARDQRPHVVSVELGGNEVLDARVGIAIPGVTLYPYEQWAPLYSALLDSVRGECPPPWPRRPPTRRLAGRPTC
jgi:hypothetical protein